MPGYTPPQGTQGHYEGWMRDPFLNPPKELRLASGTCSDQATLDLDLRPWVASYRVLSLVLTNWAPATNDVELWMRTSTDAGATFDAGASDYGYAITGQAVGAVANNADAADTEMVICGGSGAGRAVSNAAGETLCAKIYMYDFSNTTNNKLVSSYGTFIDNVPEPSSFTQGGVRWATTDIDAIRLLFQSGNISSGFWTLYGMT